MIAGVAFGMVVFVKITDVEVICMLGMMMAVIMVSMSLLGRSWLRVRHCMRRRDQGARHGKHNTKKSNPDVAHVSCLTTEY
ncbi:MAG: hypothetical protein C0421_01650 [Hyphomonas sp.]|nr:hypothetical protein [Hyphomonas sp.]